MATTDSLRRGIRQFQTTTGRRITPEALQALLAAELDVQASRSADNRALELRELAIEEDIKLGRERLDAEKNAAKMGGITQLAGTAVQGGMLLKGTSVGKAIGGGIKSGAQKLGSAIGFGSPAVSGTTQLATMGAGGTGTAAFAYNPAVASLQAGAPAVGPAAASAPGAVSANTASGSAAGTVGGTVLPATAGASAGRLGGDLLFQGDSTAKDVGTIGGGAAVGAYLGAPGGPVGMAIGAVIGAAVGVVYDTIADSAGTVVCTELHRQGHIPTEILELDNQHRCQNIDARTYAGYLRWGAPLAKKMKTSRRVTKIVRPFGVAWAYEMAHRMNPKIKGRLLGKALLFIGVPICRLLGKEARNG